MHIYIYIYIWNINLIYTYITKLFVNYYAKHVVLPKCNGAGCK